MKNLLILFIIAFLFSCKKELTPKEKYEEETYQLINDALISVLESGKWYTDDSLSLYNVNEKSFYHFVYYQPIKYKPIIQSFLEKEFNQSYDTLFIEKWDNKKLQKIKLIKESDTLKKVRKLYHIENRKYYENKQEREVIENIYEIYQKEWKKSNGEIITTISSPLFNGSYSKAIIFYYIKNDCLGMGCGIIMKKDVFFKKVNNKWIVVEEM